MSKKCSHCGFTENPDNANYCGNCGEYLKNVGLGYIVLRSSYYYNHWSYKNGNKNYIVSNERMAELKNFEIQATKSRKEKTKKLIESYWKSFINWISSDQIIGWLLAVSIVIILFLVYWFLLRK